MRPLIGCLILIAACSAAEDERETVQIADIELTPPSGWTAKEYAPNTWVWSAPDHRETLTVIVGPAFAGDASQALSETVRAQALLPAAQVIATKPVTTASGLGGNRIDV